MNHINNTENENRISMKPIEKKSLYLKISDAIYFTKDILEYTSSNNDTILQPSQDHIFETGDLHYTKL